MWRGILVVIFWLLCMGIVGEFDRLDAEARQRDAQYTVTVDKDGEPQLVASK